MNGRLISMVLGLGLSLGAQAYAQSAIAPATQTGASISDSDQKTIRAFVTAQAALIGGSDADQQGKARDLLIKKVSGESAAFADIYGQAVNDAMLELSGNAEFRVRLNAAIVVARVAEKTKSLRLKPVALKFLQDHAAPVVLWGVKAHAALIPAQLRTQIVPNEPLISNLPVAVEDNLSAPIVQAAYEALRMDLVTQRTTLTDEMFRAVVPAVQDIVAMRAAEYKDGIPDIPVVDNLGTGFLVDGSVLKAQTTEQKTRSAQLVCDILAGAAKQAAYLDKGSMRKDDVIQAIKLFGSAIHVIGQARGKQTIADAAMPVSRLDTSSEPAAIIKACDDLIVAITAEVPGLKKPVTKPAP